MGISIKTSFLTHDDPEASLRFYRDLLGLTLLNDVGYEGMRWLTFGAEGQDVNVVLTPPVPEGTDADRQAFAELLAKGVLGGLLLTTDDLDATFDSLVAAGVDVVSEPTDQPWGVRDCAVRDPAGNLLRLDQR